MASRQGKRLMHSRLWILIPVLICLAGCSSTDDAEDRPEYSGQSELDAEPAYLAPHTNDLDVRSTPRHGGEIDARREGSDRAGLD